jgi:RHS repeat-associated protein
MEPGALIRKHPIDAAVLCVLLCVAFVATSSLSNEIYSWDYKWYAATYQQQYPWGRFFEASTQILQDGYGDYNGAGVEAVITGPNGPSPLYGNYNYPSVYWAGLAIPYARTPGTWRCDADHYVQQGSTWIYVASTYSEDIVAPPPSINYFYHNPGSVPFTLYWSTTYATSVNINGTSVAASGSMSVTPSSTTTYTLTATNANGSTQATTIVRTNEPLNPNYHRYSVRHEKGSPPFFPYMQMGQEAVNSANGNLHFALPLLSRPGRNGMGLDLMLSYNSKIWDFFVQGSTLYATLPEYDSWVGPGWTLTAGRMIDDSANGYYYFTSSDGANHTLANYGGAWRSVDSTYMVYDPATRKLTLKNGVSIQFGDLSDPVRLHMRYAVRMQDTNGNYIDISYAQGSTGGRISTIQDTLGNTYTFLLNSNGNLQNIQYTNTINATSIIAFTYQSQTLSFGSQATMDPLLLPQKMLTQVTYPTTTRYNFTYRSSGEVEQITYPTFGKSRYFYTKYTVYDRLLGRTVPDWYVTSHDTGISTPVWNWSNNPNSNPAPTIVQITVPGKSTLKHYMEKTGPGWASGMVTKVTYADATLSNASQQDWTQDDEQLTTIRNPRVSWTLAGKKLANWPYTQKFAKSEFIYASVSDYSGNVKEIREYRFDETTLRRKTALTYLHESNGSYATLNIKDRATSTLVYDGSNNLKSKTVTAYDDFSPLYAAPNAIRHDAAFGTAYVTRGLPTSVTRWYNIAQNGSYTAFTKYDECGNVRQVINPRNLSTFTEYWLSSADNAYAFPLRVTNAKGHVTQATYSYKSGVILTATDANGQVSTMSYNDNADRLTQSLRADGARKTITYAENSYPETPYALVRNYTDASNYVEKRVDLDWYGRLKEEKVLGNIEQEQTYDDAGVVLNRNLPHISEQTEYPVSFSTGGVTAQSTSYPDGRSITYTNGPDSVTVQSSDGSQNRYYYQEDGKIRQVWEPDPATGELYYYTDYTYDALGRLETITQDVQTRSFTYDDMGRVITETFPETGTTSYFYDEASNLVLKTDSRGTTTTHYYDELNRLTLKTYSDGTPETSYSYDVQPGDSPITTSNPVGRLTRTMRTVSGVTTKNFYGYCSCSSVLQEATVILDGTTRTYITTYTYNLAGQLTSMMYPNGRVVNYTRDTQGRETKVWSTYQSQPFDYIYGAVYGGPQGGLTQIQFPIFYGPVRVTTEFTYAPQSLLLSSMKVGGSIHNFNYVDESWQPTSRIQDIVNTSNPANSEHYSYDKMGRLKARWKSAQRADTPWWKEEYSYDRYGNLTEVVVDDLGLIEERSYSVDAATNRVTSAPDFFYPAYFSYDNAGNRIDAGIFDAENRLVWQGGKNYLYDGNGRRFRKQGDATVNFIYSHSGQLLVEDNVTNSTTDDLIYFGGQMVAIHRNQDSCFGLLQRDYLGSTVNSWTVNIQDYSTSSFSSNYGFQGKYQEDGYVYFGARYLDNRGWFGLYVRETRRWFSADPITTRIYDPQSLNKYTYVRNDPVNLVDPDGRFVQGHAILHDTNFMLGFRPGGLGAKDEHKSDIRAKAVQDMLDRWDTLTEQCRNGLTTAMSGTGIGAIKGRLAALDRVLAAQNTLEAITTGSSIKWQMIAAIGIRETGFVNKSEVDGTGVGVGIFQITVKPTSGITATQASDLSMAAYWVLNRLRETSSKLVDMNLDYDSAQFDQALAASYNMYPSSKNFTGDPNTIDEGTTDSRGKNYPGNYGSNILDLMDCFN